MNNPDTCTETLLVNEWGFSDCRRWPPRAADDPNLISRGQEGLPLRHFR